MINPGISVIMPVYNVEQYLAETIESLQKQTFEDFEVICVDDESTDASCDILQETMKTDGRFILLHQKHAGAGAARNFGFSNARGEYAIFLDSDDLFSEHLLEKLYQAAVENEADIAACNFCRFSPDGKENQQEGVHTKWIPEGRMVFNYQDCPDYIMRVINPTPWNKLYRSAFIREHDLKYEEISSTNDITFAAVSVATAGRITYIPDSLVRYRIGHAGTISSQKSDKLNNVKTAVLSAAEQALALPYSDVIKNSVLCFVIDNFLFSLAHYIKDFSAHEAAEFYQMVHETFNRDEFADVESGILNSYKQYMEFCTVRKHDYATMKRMVSKRLIVSLTTYPRRIGLIPKVLESIYNQTRKADEIVLWLAEEQFPGRESDLPENVLQLVSEKRLTVRWCDDLKPHKKYFYAFQEYSDDLVVTIDDDLVYSRNMLSSLYASYLLYPNAVSTVRAHLIIVNEQNEILPYRYWIQETDACIYKPSMQLMATGGAGVLNPPGLYRKEFFDKEAIVENCLWADDLWLKAMQLVSDVPVVLARPFEQLQYLPDSQEEALHIINVRQRKNDVQLENISKWADEKWGPGILVKKLTGSDNGVNLLGVEAVSQHLDKERRMARSKAMQADSKLKQTEGRLRQADSKLKQADSKLKQTEGKLRQAENKLTQAETKRKQEEISRKQTESKLKQTEGRLRQAEESKPIKRQLKDLGKFLRGLKEQGHSPITWWFKYLIYLLAWIPEIILAGMMFYLENGFKRTLRYAFNKLLRRR